MNHEEKEAERRSKRKNICMIQSGSDIICVDPSLPLLSSIGKKYSLLILAILEKEGIRKNFNEILKSIPYSSSTIISKRLKELEEIKLLRRRETQDGVDYALTPTGMEVVESLIPLLRVAEKFGSL